MCVGSKSQAQHILGTQMLDTIITKPCRHWVLNKSELPSPFLCAHQVEEDTEESEDEGSNSMKYQQCWAQNGPKSDLNTPEGPREGPNTAASGLFAAQTDEHIGPASQTTQKFLGVEGTLQMDPAAGTKR